MLVVFIGIFLYDEDEVRKMNFGSKLQNLRKEKGLSQEALAQRLHVSRQAVSKWETGEGYPEMDKMIMISDMFQVSLDYLLKEQDQEYQEATQYKYFMNTQMIHDYIMYKKNFALRIGASVAAIVLSVNLPIVFNYRQNESLGEALMLIVIALSVALLIATGMSHENYSQLEKKEINMSSQDLQDLQNEYIHFKGTFGMSIAFGVCLIIMSVAGVVIFEEFLHLEDLGVIVLLVCVAIAVFIFIYQGIKSGMYEFLIQNQEFVMQKKKEEEKSSLYAFTMPLAAMIYLVIGFTKELWHPGWIIFPMTAIMTYGIETLIYKDQDK